MQCTLFHGQRKIINQNNIADDMAPNGTSMHKKYVRSSSDNYIACIEMVKISTIIVS